MQATRSNPRTRKLTLTSTCRCLSCPLLMSMFQSMLKELIDGPAKSIWVRQGLPPDDLQNLRLTETPDPSVDSSFKLGTAAQVCTHLEIPRPHQTVLLLIYSCDRSLLLASRLWPPPTFTSFGRVRRRKCTLTLGTPFWNSASLSEPHVLTKSKYFFRQRKVLHYRWKDTGGRQI